VKQGCLWGLGGLLGVLIVAIAAIWGTTLYVQGRLSPKPETVAQASLEGLREQNRLSTFAARYVAVVTSKQNQMGLTAQKTMIMPGMVRYEVDLSKLRQRDVRWDANTRTLRVVLPPIEVVGPEVDFNHIREYGAGGILMALTDAEAQIDSANRNAAQTELIRQAREETPMRLARDATRRAVANSFAMPLRAAGLDAQVEVKFPDEIGASERWDVSRSLEEVFANKQ